MEVPLERLEHLARDGIEAIHACGVGSHAPLLSGTPAILSPIAARRVHDRAVDNVGTVVDVDLAPGRLVR
jgi:hypothetical protein